MLRLLLIAASSLGLDICRPLGGDLGLDLDLDLDLDGDLFLVESLPRCRLSSDSEESLLSLLPDVVLPSDPESDEVSVLLEVVSDPEEDDESSLEDSSRFAAAAAAAVAACCAAISLGRFFNTSRMLSVSPPRPMEVKKLMENRMFLGVSFGKSPSNH